MIIYTTKTQDRNGYKCGLRTASKLPSDSSERKEGRHTGVVKSLGKKYLKWDFKGLAID